MCRLEYNIILCGFMGCGKTTVGKILSRILKAPYVDMDKYIEDDCGMKVSEIFAKYGEGHFRELEREAAKKLSENQGMIISAGGGTLTFKENVEALSSSGRIVFIDTPVEDIIYRLRGDTTRPLLQCENREQVIKDLHKKRTPLYKAAATVYVDGSLPPKVVAKSIASIILRGKYNNKGC